MLHAWKLAFTHPITGEALSFEAGIPEPFKPWTDKVVEELRSLDGLRPG
jgi:hypothetical protein